MIEFNNATGKFEFKVNGQVIADSPNQQYLKQKIRNMGQAAEVSPSLFTAVSAPAAPVVSEFSVDERFEFIERFTRGVANGSYLSLVLVGGPGLGKTHTVLDTLRKEGLTEILPLDVPAAKEGETTEEDLEKMMEMPEQTEGDFIVIKGFSTPKAMYRTLFENNGKIIVFDDADGAFRQPDAANILKGALDSGDKRYISWGTERRGDDGLPTRFAFTGRVIFISNLAMKDFPQAILSRAVHVDLSLTLDEKIERIEKILKSIPQEGGKVNDVMELIREKAPVFKELSVRTAMVLLNIRRAEKDDRMFRRMSLYHATH